MATYLSFCHAEIPTLVFLTKIDTYDPDVIGQDLKKTFHSERLLTLVEVSSYMSRMPNCCQLVALCSSCSGFMSYYDDATLVHVLPEQQDLDLHSRCFMVTQQLRKVAKAMTAFDCFATILLPQHW